MTQSSQDIFFIQKTLQLAKKGVSWVFPNPFVGAVIVKNGKIIGQGYHKRAGSPHAEIEALERATSSATGATLYVNLEPCSHFGKTPPCVDALVQAGISRVVCCSTDPNPKVHGSGITALRAAGIAVSVGILAQEARRFNEAFFTFHEKKRPFIAIKFAASLDGKIATRTGDSQWITNEKARFFARRLRSHYQAILVGINTVLHDDPHLGVRMRGKKDPLRIILDSTLKIPLTSQVLRDTNVLIVTTTRANRKKKMHLEKKGISFLTFDNQSISIPQLLLELFKQEITSVFVEGGGKVLGNFVDSGCVDKVYAFYAPLLIGGENGVSAIGGKGRAKVENAHTLTRISFQRFDDNFLISGYTI